MARFLQQAKARGWIHGVKISRSPAIINLMFADDLTILCRANMEETEELLLSFIEFCSWSGQLINFSKSSIHFSNNVQAVMRRNIYNKLGMKECITKEHTWGFHSAKVHLKQRLFPLC